MHYPFLTSLPPLPVPTPLLSETFFFNVSFSKDAGNLLIIFIQKFIIAAPRFSSWCFRCCFLFGICKNGTKCHFHFKITLYPQISALRKQSHIITAFLRVSLQSFEILSPLALIFCASWKGFSCSNKAKVGKFQLAVSWKNLNTGFWNFAHLLLSSLCVCVVCGFELIWIILKKWVVIPNVCVCYACMHAWVCVCVFCVCMCERERRLGRKRDTERAREDIQEYTSVQVLEKARAANPYSAKLNYHSAVVEMSQVRWKIAFASLVI